MGGPKWFPHELGRLEPAALAQFMLPEEAVLLDAALIGDFRLKTLHIKRYACQTEALIGPSKSSP